MWRIGRQGSGHVSGVYTDWGLISSGYLGALTWDFLGPSGVERDKTGFTQIEYPTGQ